MMNCKKLLTIGFLCAMFNCPLSAAESATKTLPAYLDSHDIQAAYNKYTFKINFKPENKEIFKARVKELYPSITDEEIDGTIEFFNNLGEVLEIMANNNQAKYDELQNSEDPIDQAKAELIAKLSTVQEVNEYPASPDKTLIDLFRGVASVISNFNAKNLMEPKGACASQPIFWLFDDINRLSNIDRKNQQQADEMSKIFTELSGGKIVNGSSNTITHSHVVDTIQNIGYTFWRMR